MLKLFNRKKKDNKGFTLVELVIAVAILAILVGILAPQYTKYVEKSRKSADASNLEEMVKAVQVHEADTDNTTLATGDYTITMTTSAVTITGTGLDNVLKEYVPDYASKKLKSQRWGTAGIKATINIDSAGKLTVKYSPDALSDYIGVAKTTTGGNTGN